MKFHSFEEFLNENLEISVMNDETKAFLPIFKEAKSNGTLKAFSVADAWPKEYRSQWRNEHSLGLDKFNEYVNPVTTYRRSANVYKAIFSNGSYAEFFIYQPDKHSLGDARPYSFRIMCAWEDSSLPLSSVEKVFPDKIKGSLKNIEWNIEKKIISVSEIEKIVGSKIGHLQTLCYSYYGDPEIIESKVELSDIQNTQEYKDLMNMPPIELVSTPLQIKKNALVFGFNALTVFGNPKGTLSYTEIDSNEKYLRIGYSLFSRGYIREYPIWGDREVSIAGSFNSNNLEGWKKGLRTIKDLFLKYIKSLQEDGTEVYYTAEDIEKKRGKITGKKYGL